MCCATCAADGVNDPYRTLASSGPVANLAVLDDTPYLALGQH
jgi:hypothetical protein